MRNSAHLLCGKLQLGANALQGTDKERYVLSKRQERSGHRGDKLPTKMNEKMNV